jgi:hypothetical protein
MIFLTRPLQSRGSTPLYSLPLASALPTYPHSPYSPHTLILSLLYYFSPSLPSFDFLIHKPP